MISLLSRCQSSVSSAKLVLFSFQPSSSHKAFHKESAHSTPPGGQYHHTQSHRAPTCLEGSTIIRCLTEHSAAWRAVPSHAASQSTLPGQYHHTLPYRALCCLEGSTMSNLVHRRRRCARIVLYTILCLEGSTPEDRCLSWFLSYGCHKTNPLNSFHPY